MSKKKFENQHRSTTFSVYNLYHKEQLKKLTFITSIDQIFPEISVGIRRSRFSKVIEGEYHFMITSVKEEAAECDWISLLLLAKEIGVTVEEIRAFIDEFKSPKQAN